MSSVLNNEDKYVPYNFTIKHPKNILLVFSFFSPFIVIFFFTFLGMYFSPLTGIIYLITIIVTIFIRYGIYNWFKSLIDSESNSCDLINYSGIGSGDIYLSLWVFAFTIFYIIVPLFSNNGFQKSLITFLVIFLIMFVCDIVIKSIYRCYSLVGKKPYNIFLNMILGGFFGVLFSLGYSMIDPLKSHLFFNKQKSNETCEKVNDTKFQCSFDFE